MRVVVADTGPLNYLVLIGEIDVLPSLFETVYMPAVVRAELRHREALPAVRTWAARLPRWLEVRAVTAAGDDPAWRALDAGERAALALARVLDADLVLMDDRAGVEVVL